MSLRHLIAEAVALGGGDLCASGHQWEPHGDRPCPTGCANCGQSVYRCRHCGTYDYGDSDNSPGRTDCQAVCGDSMTGWQWGHLDPEFQPPKSGD